MPYNRTSVVSWNPSCRSNGKISSYEIKAVNKEDNQATFNYSVKAGENQAFYSISTEDFLPDSNYTISIWAVGDDISGNELIKDFPIEAGCK